MIYHIKEFVLLVWSGVGGWVRLWRSGSWSKLQTSYHLLDIYFITSWLDQ